MSERLVCAWAPHHITAFFKPVVKPGDPTGSGSIGAGLVVGPEARVCIGRGSNPKLEPLRTVIETIVGSSDVLVEHLDPLPFERGYASSAAGAIAGALASAVYKGYPTTRALRVAHIAEVIHRTGLGDVLAITGAPYGGIAVRVEAGPPGYGIVEAIPLPLSLGILSIEGKPMSTRELLSRYDERYENSAMRALNKLLDDMTAETFVEEATRHTIDTGVAKFVLGESGVELVSKAPGLIGFYAKKSVVVLLVERDRITDAVDYIERALGLRARVLEAYTQGLTVKVL